MSVGLIRRVQRSNTSGTAAVLGVLAVALAFACLTFPDAYPWPVAMKGALLGTGTGLLAVGLVLIYRTTRIINFAYGAMGGFAASIAIGLYRRGIPVIRGWSTFEDVDWVQRVPWFAAVGVAVAIGVGTGACIQLIVIRRFANSPRLVLTVATIGLAQLLGGAALFVPTWFDLPPSLNSFDTPLSDFDVGEMVVFDGNDFALLAVVPVILIGLGWFLLRSDTGIAIRGMAENMDRARLLGIPVNLLSLLLWSIAGAVVALTVVLTAPNQGVALDAMVGPTLLLPPLAAAVVARMTSLSIAFMAGVGLGILDQLVQWNFFNRRELRYVFFLGVIVVALLLERRQTSRALQEDSSWTAVGVATRLPRALAALPELRIAKVVIALFVVGALVAIPVWGDSAQINYATVTAIFALAALSLVVLSGWGGVVSLGQMALMGVGGITAANLIADRNSDFFLVLGASAVTGGLVALLIGLPGLRVVGQYLAVTTLAFAVVMEQYVVKPSLHPDLFPGRFRRPELWGRVDLSDERWLYVIAVALVVFTAFVIHNIRRARPGRSIAAVRDNERRAAAAGISSVETRLAAFVMAGMFAGLAGALHAVLLTRVGEQTYPASTSLLLFSMAVIGGVSSVGGTVAGVVLVRWIGYVNPRLQILLTGVGLLAILMVVPGGLTQVFERMRDRFATRCGRRHGIGVSDGGSADGGRRRVPATVAHAPVPASANGAELLLRCSDVNAAYGSFQVLFGVSVDVAKGEMLALLGTNGAGKSSLLKAVSGLLRANSGAVTFGGDDITRLQPEQLARRGLSLMPGGRGVFPTLTVAENLRIAGYLHGCGHPASRAARAEALDLFPILRRRFGQRAGDLSGGEQQQLSLAMAFVTRPKLLLIDELSLGLAPAVVAQLIGKVREIHRSGTTVVVVEQSVSIALQLCEHAVFLEQGHIRFRGPTAGLLERPDVLRAVFLGDTGAMPDEVGSGNGDRSLARPSRGVGLECRGLVKRFGGLRALDSVNLYVPPASLVGLVGHNGAGKTTLFDVLGGFLTADHGVVKLGDHDVTNLSPRQRAIASLGRSFQDARLFGSLTVGETLMVALETHLASRDPLAAGLLLPVSLSSERAARRRVDELVELLGLGRYHDRPTGELSTGTRRIVELGCLLAQDPAVILLDEPMAGVAQKEKEHLPPLLRHVRDETGSSMVIIEHDMKLLGELCDQLVALELGAVIAIGRPADVLADDRVIASYLGTEPVPA